jgi:hypothetical protein
MPETITFPGWIIIYLPLSYTAIFWFGWFIHKFVKGK